MIQRRRFEWKRFGVLCLLGLTGGVHDGGASVTSSAVLGCRDGSWVRRTEGQGAFYLARRLGSVSAVEAAELWLRFAIGFYKNRARGPRVGLIAPSLVQGATEVVREEASTYPVTIDVDAYREMNHPYVQAAFRDHGPRAGEPARKIHVRFVMDLAYCAPPGQSPSEAGPEWNALELPADPFLALWLTPKALRREAKYGPHKGVVPACSTDEMAEFGGVSEYWYHWWPEDPRIHAGRKCSDLLRAGSEVVRVPLSEIHRFQASPTSDVFTRQPGDRRPIRLSFVMGNVIRDTFRQLNLSALRKQLAQLTRPESQQAGALWHERPRRFRIPERLSTPADFYEPGAGELLHLLAFLPQFAKLERVRELSLGARGNREQNIALEIQGRLNQSGTPFVLTVFYGQTVPRPGYQPAHRPWVERAIRKEDALIYLGHAGLGTSMPVGIKPVLREKWAPKFTLAVLSCESFSYFGQDLARTRRELGLPTELILSARKDVGSKYVLGLLRALDQSVAGERFDLPGLLTRYTPAGEFLVKRTYAP